MHRRQAWSPTEAYGTRAALEAIAWMRSGRRLEPGAVRRYALPAVGGRDEAATLLVVAVCEGETASARDVIAEAGGQHAPVAWLEGLRDVLAPVPLLARSWDPAHPRVRSRHPRTLLALRRRLVRRTIPPAMAPGSL